MLLTSFNSSPGASFVRNCKTFDFSTTSCWKLHWCCKDVGRPAPCLAKMVSPAKLVNKCKKHSIHGMANQSTFPIWARMRKTGSNHRDTHQKVTSPVCVCFVVLIVLPVVPHKAVAEVFTNRKPIGEVGCCESGMAERIHWWTERCLRSPLFLSLSLFLTIYLSFYLSIYQSV